MRWVDEFENIEIQYFAVCLFLQKLILTDSIKLYKRLLWMKKDMTNNMAMFIARKP